MQALKVWRQLVPKISTGKIECSAEKVAEMWKKFDRMTAKTFYLNIFSKFLVLIFLSGVVRELKNNFSM
jgi:hypothetical protein